MNIITNQNAYNKLVFAFLGQYKALMGKPMYKMVPGTTSNKLVVQVPYFMPKGALTEAKINALGMAIARLLPEPGAVELRLIRLRYPYLDSAVLGQYLSMNAGKYNFARMQKMIFRKAATIQPNSVITAKDALPTLLTGVKLELAGRLTTQRSIPRKTVENQHKGSFTAHTSFSQYASKNKLGSYTMKV